MKKYLVSGIFSLSLVSLVQAEEISAEEQCLALGYDTKISDCDAAGSAALVCPVNNGSSDMAICITDSCRGYPLFKKNGKFYYHDLAGNEIEAVPSKGQLTDYMEGDFETCTAGYGDNAVTYYRVPQCKGEALYNNYFCDVGCAPEKYPYTYHPGNTVGVVQRCVTADETYYGYSSCNKGWIGGWSSPSGEGKCSLDDCDMETYPYIGDPNETEMRGSTEICKIAGGAYYRYTECVNETDYILKGSVCSKKCKVSCGKIAEEKEFILEGDSAVTTDIIYKNWNCRITTPNCRVGDIAVLDDVEIGIVVEHTNDSTLLMPLSLENPVNLMVSFTSWSLKNIDIPRLKNNDFETSGKFLTQGILAYKQEMNLDGFFPAYKCNAYNFTAECPHDMCQAGQWFLPNYRELKLVGYSKYVLANVLNYPQFYNKTFWSSSEISAVHNAAILLQRPDDSVDGNKAGYSRPYIPMLSF